MTSAAPRLDVRLLERLERLARTDSTFADIRRELTRMAGELGVPGPSYEHVRRLVTLERLDFEATQESAALPVLVDVMLGREHGNELLRVARGGRRRRRA